MSDFMVVLFGIVIGACVGGFLAVVVTLRKYKNTRRDVEPPQ